MRDFLFDALTHPREGYFARQAPVGVLSEPIAFNFLLGENGWRAKQQQLYRELKTSWLTPVELFKPWYGEAVARYIIRQHMRARPDQPLRIIEAGAGQGTLAANIMDFVERSHPRLYDRMTYRTVEVSQQLADAQRRRLEPHGGKFSVSIGDARDPAVWGTGEPVYTYVVAMEVVDNLPHDRVSRARPDAEWNETWVHRDPASGELVEVLRPLQDPLVRQCLHGADWSSHATPDHHSPSLWERLLDAAAGLSPGVSSADEEQTLFLPTGCLQLFHALHRALPAHHLICADFTMLPATDIQIPGTNAPIVSSTVDGRNEDYSTYLLPAGTADIFFPSNFVALRDLWMTAGNVKAQAARADLLTTAEFMTSYADVHRTKTASAYNPLLDDFANTSFLLAAKQ